MTVMPEVLFNLKEAQACKLQKPCADSAVGVHFMVVWHVPAVWHVPPRQTVGQVYVQTSIEELTGSCKRVDRQDLWELPYKRIFFSTPQTFRNDLDRGKHFASSLPSPLVLIDLSPIPANFPLETDAQPVLANFPLKHDA